MTRETRVSTRASNPTRRGADKKRIKRVAVTADWTQYTAPVSINRGYFKNVSDNNIELRIDTAPSNYLTLTPNETTPVMPLQPSETLNIKGSGTGDVEIVGWNE